MSLKIWISIHKNRKNCDCCPVSLLIVRSQYDCHDSCYKVFNRQIASSVSKVTSQGISSIKVFSKCICHCLCPFVGQAMSTHYCDQMSQVPWVTLSVVLWNVWLLEAPDRPAKRHCFLLSCSQTLSGFWKYKGIKKYYFLSPFWPSACGEPVSREEKNADCDLPRSFPSCATRKLQERAAEDNRSPPESLNSF